ncbi:MAG: VCBS repeat-containing protein [Flavobacteriales bacterium]|nr:VCBS repeat-containing protein [Flavobacteriales bacterium]
MVKIKHVLLVLIVLLILNANLKSQVQLQIWIPDTVTTCNEISIVITAINLDPIQHDSIQIGLHAGNLLFFLDSSLLDENGQSVHPLFLDTDSVHFQIDQILSGDSKDYTIVAKSIEQTCVGTSHSVALSIAGNLWGTSLITVTSNSNAFLLENPLTFKEETFRIPIDTVGSNTWGVTWVDYDNDGWEDLFVTNYNSWKHNSMYRNNGNGTFTEQALGQLTSQLGNSVSSTWADYNNDGLTDAFISNNTGSLNSLYTNLGSGVFQKIVNGSVNEFDGNCHNAIWLDVENDGFVDLFITDYNMQEHNRLFHNFGNGYFSDITPSSMIQDTLKSIGATAADIDNDGDLDIVVPCTHGQNNVLYINDGNGNFERDSTSVICADGGYSVGACWGDVDNDLDMDLFISNTSSQLNYMYINDGFGGFTRDLSYPFNTDIGHASGATFVDVENDGDLDLMVTHDQGISSRLYINDGTGSFTRDSSIMSTVLGYSYPNAVADYDNDGDLDFFIGNMGGGVDMLITNNFQGCNNWCCFNLIGVSSNYNAIGAKIRIHSVINGISTWQLREISSQSGGGAGSQSTRKAYFGIGNAEFIDTVLIFWPSGLVQMETFPIINDCNIYIESSSGTIVSGTCFEDLDLSCGYDTNEVGIAGIPILILPDSIVVLTNYLGEYSYYLQNGNYQLKQIGHQGVKQICPIDTNGYFLTITGGIVQDIDFADTLVKTMLYPEICQGDTLATAFSSYTSSGVYTEILIDEFGFDSIVEHHLTVHPTYYNIDLREICSGDTVLFQNQLYSSSGIYDHHLLSINGCDSLETLDLTIVELNIPLNMNHDTLESITNFDAYQWLDCNNNYAPIAGETNQIYVADQNGYYAVEVTEVGCRDTSICVTISGVAIEELTHDFNLQVYPNPSTGRIHIKWPDPMNLSIRIFNAHGSLLSRYSFDQSSNTSLSLKLVSGIYLLEAVSEEGEIAMFKIIVQN